MPEPRPTEERLEQLADRRLDLAARAAWLYHARNRRQDEIARTLNLSRQVVQRLIALAASEKLLRFELVHPLAAAVELADRIRDRFGLGDVEVVPGTDRPEDNVASVAAAVAFRLEGLFASEAPVVVGVGGWRVMRDAASRVRPMQRPMHRIVSLMGNLTRGGRAGHYDVVMGLAERVGAACFPLPTPVVAGTAEEKRVLQAQPAFRACLALAEGADLLLMGIGPMTGTAPLLRDGFITENELRRALDAGAVGELLGHCFDADGTLLAGPFGDRLTSFPIRTPARPRTVIAQCGAERVPALRAALAGRLADGLITDEDTAGRLLGD